MSRGTFFGQKARDIQQCLRTIGSFTDGQASIVDWDSDNLSSITVQLRPNSGLYEGGIFNFLIKFPKRYPEMAPRVVCLTNIFHPNIVMNTSEDTNVCFSLYGEWHEAQHSLDNVINALLFLLNYPNLRDPWSPFIHATMSRKTLKKKVRQSLAGMSLPGIDLAFQKFIEYDKSLDDLESCDSEYDSHEEDAKVAEDMTYFGSTGEMDTGNTDGREMIVEHQEKEMVNSNHTDRLDDGQKEAIENDAKEGGIAEEKPEVEDLGREENRTNISTLMVKKRNMLDIKEILVKVDGMVSSLKHEDFVDSCGKYPYLYCGYVQWNDPPKPEQEVKQNTAQVTEKLTELSTPDTSACELPSEHPAEPAPFEQATTSEHAILSRKDTEVLPENDSASSSNGSSKRCKSVEDLMQEFPRTLTSVVALSRQETKSIMDIAKTPTAMKRRHSSTGASCSSANKKLRPTEKSASDTSVSCDRSSLVVTPDP
ncbi:hypothetical protein CAPTEDRAFT_193169 [Capitella teleta]|uniref:UBC core domain-containing protein n=1 Tax=Capitella teleta TaxID=283909 RepID=R7UNV6_CAPTE|nr:hypothetical protein CAPTEDRAFT_193169 [Capitella teleta]|eukprot:ELU07798.1 hypothetical protein CAPTEDRAFT_193169 [Capitella teleta]